MIEDDFVHGLISYMHKLFSNEVLQMPFLQSERSWDLCLMGKSNPCPWLEWQALSIKGILDKF
jgi:hypothetical protein